MDKYELVVIVNAAISQDEKDSVSKQTTDYVAKIGGKVINTQLWLDKFKMSFPIKKCPEGTYFLTNFESQRTAIDNLKESLRLNEKILRYAIYNVSQ